MTVNKIKQFSVKKIKQLVDGIDSKMHHLLNDAISYEEKVDAIALLLNEIDSLKELLVHTLDFPMEGINVEEKIKLLLELRIILGLKDFLLIDNDLEKPVGFLCFYKRIKESCSNLFFYLYELTKFIENLPVVIDENESRIKSEIITKLMKEKAEYLSLPFLSINDNINNDDLVDLSQFDDSDFEEKNNPLNLAEKINIKIEMNNDYESYYKKYVKNQNENFEKWSKNYQLENPSHFKESLSSLLGDKIDKEKYEELLVFISEREKEKRKEIDLIEEKYQSEIARFILPNVTDKRITKDLILDMNMESIFMEIIRMNKFSERNTLLKKIESINPLLIKKIHNLIFFFEDFSLLDDRSIQKILREVDTLDIGVALKGADISVKEAILRNFSEEAAALLQEDMDFMGFINKKRIDEAKIKMCDIVEKLVKAGEIILDLD
jgi:flagellar FliG-like protein